MRSYPEKKSQTQFVYALLQILIKCAILLKVLFRFIFCGLRFSVIIGRRKKIAKAVDMKKRETMMNMSVPYDVVREIFLYLPCKSLCRFRCVSKEYCSCINDDQFMEEHRKRNMKASHLLGWDSVYTTNLQLFSVSTDCYAHIKTINTYKYNRASSSSYGMVFLLHEWDYREIALLNPSSEEIIPLPNLLESILSNIGFGFEPRSRRYKIVQFIAYSETIRRLHIVTVTRNGSSLKSIYVVQPSKFIVALFSDQPICVDGVLYWDTWNAHTDVNVIVFDLRTEEMQIVKSPATWRRWLGSRRNCGSLAVLEGKLCCYDMDPTANTLLSMNIWKIDGHAGWTPWYKFEIYGPISISYSLFPLYFYDDKKILFQEFSYCQYPRRVYIYDSEDKTLKIYPMAEKEAVVESFDLTVHSETMSYLLD